MTKNINIFRVCLLASALLLALIISPYSASAEGTSAEEGKKIAFTRKGNQGVGNCIACHVMADGEAPGNMGPPLVAMKQRFPDRELLRQRLYDPTLFNPISAMPPFGKHRILTENEIEKVIDYLYTL